MSHQPSHPSERGYAATPHDARPVPVDTALKLLIKGFKPLEHQLLNGTVKLSQRRQPRLSLVSDADGETADVVMIDARDPLAVKWAAGQSWLEGKTVIWVDATTAPRGHTVIRRPVQWPAMPMLLARALEQGPRKSTPDAQAATSAPASASRSVLVVDDSVVARAYLRSLLEPRGVTVDVADSAEAGIKAAAAAPYASILMDVMMPGIDGYEACRRIKARGRTGTAPAVVMLTSKSSPFDRIRGKMAGCDDYLVKPVDPDRLYQVLSRYVAVLSDTGARPPGVAFTLGHA